MFRSPSSVPTPGSTPATGVVTTFTVVGMTCQHCVGAVTDEITDLITGVDRVDVRLTDGQVTVISTARPTGAQLSAAVEEAGYTIAQGSLR